MNQYPNDIFINWHVDSYGEKYSIKREEEPYLVERGKIVLNEIPDKHFGILLEGFQEVDTIKQENDFAVDYTQGFIWFHSSKEGETIIINKYYGRGLAMYPASRIYGVDSENKMYTLEEKILSMEQRLATLL